MADPLITKKITDVQMFANNDGTILQIQSSQLGQTPIATMKEEIKTDVVAQLLSEGGVSLGIVNIKGVVATLVDLNSISDPQINDAYQVEDESLFYVWDGTIWVGGFNLMPEPIGIVEEGNTNAVSGGEVFDFINENLKIKSTAVLDQVGSINYFNGSITSINVNFRCNLPIDVKKGEVVKFGSNVLYNSGSVSSLLCKYKSDGSFSNSLINIKDISSTQFYEGEWIADEDCKVSVVTNITVNLGSPYLNLVQKRFVPDSELDARVDSGVDRYVKKPPILIEKTEDIDLIGYWLNDGNVNTTTNTTRRTDYIYLKSGERVEFGVNGTANPASTGAILNIYDRNKVLLENKIKFIEHISVWFESSFTATQDCYVGISTNNTNFDPVKRPYVKSFKSDKYLLNVEDIDVLVASNYAVDYLNEKIDDVKTLIDNKDSLINDKTFISSGKKIILSGTSFSYSNISWFYTMCNKLGIEGINNSYSGERINNFSARINAGTFFTQDVLNDCDALMIMHSYNKDVYTLGDITVNGVTITASQLEDYTVEQYEALNWGILTNTATGWNGQDYEFAAVWDYVLKKIQSIYYAEKDNSNSIYFGTQWGKPFNVVVTTNWHDGRVKFNESIRKLAKKWGLVVCRFDDNIGFSRLKKHSVTNAQHSLLYASDTETINGELFAWHYHIGLDKPLVKRMASIAMRCFEVM